MKKAIMLCAGRGSRLGTLSEEIPKPLLKVNKISIIENTINNLIDYHYDEVVIIIGYKGYKIMQELEKYREKIKIKYITNDIWDKTNNIYSLWLARHELNSSVTLIEGDIFFTKELMNHLVQLENSKNYILVSPLTNLLEGTYIEKDLENKIVQFHSTKNKTCSTIEKPYKTVNIYKFSEEFNGYLVEQLENEIQNGNINSYYEDIFVKDAKNNLNLLACEIPATCWFEIDNAYDLGIGEYQFANMSKQHQILKQQHGGYWRYPIKDAALIYNFHFPPEELKEKMKSRFDDLLLNYPSNSKTIEKYLSLFLGVNAEYLLMANGVSELIKILPQLFSGNVLLLDPSFNEYSNAFKEGDICSYKLLEEKEFKPDVHKIIDIAKEKNIQALVLITPDNPTGKSISKQDILKVYSETEAQGTIIIVDESFIDFSNESESKTLLNDLNNYPRILILKSMSKTFGIGGLRLGFAASSNEELLNNIRKKMPIWNINSFAEEFIMNLPQYKKSYFESCQIVRKETDELVDSLKDIQELKVFDTDSNFVLCKIKNKQITANDLAAKLLINHNIYIKECSGKSIMDAIYFFRVSSRNQKDNEILVNSLKKVLQDEQVLTTV